MLLAFCHSDINEFKSLLHQFGIVSVANIRNERGLITGGKFFKLDTNQQLVLETMSNQYLNAESPQDLTYPHLFLTGSAGTGKTILLTEVALNHIHYLFLQFGKTINQSTGRLALENGRKIEVYVMTYKVRPNFYFFLKLLQLVTFSLFPGS